MTPYQQARAVYDREPCARSFEEDLVAHLLNGYVISTPEVFLMFRDVLRDADPEVITDPFMTFPVSDFSDCWHVYLAAGDMTQFHRFFPYPLEWVSFERKNRLRFRRFRSCAAKIANYGLLRRPLLHPGLDRP